MNRSIRWRIMVLQVVALLVLGFSAGAGFFASTFTSQQIHDQLAPQQISFPASQAQGLFPDLKQYAGQQVLNGDQAHAYAEKFIARHLQTIGQGHPYSYWSGLALNDKNPTTKAQEQGIADTLFKGETLRSMLNQAWTFSVIGNIAFYAGIALSIATLAVLAAFVFEVVEAVRAPKQTVPTKPTLQVAA